MASASCSKILNDKIYFNIVKNSRATLFFRASASCSKLLNVKSISNTVKNFRATLFSGQAQIVKNPEYHEYIHYSENFQGNFVFSGQVQEKIFNTVYIHLGRSV